MELPKKYDFKGSEEKWKKFWEKEEIYKFDPKSKKKIYVPYTYNEKKRQKRVCF